MFQDRKVPLENTDDWSIVTSTSSQGFQSDDERAILFK